ncbi:hypothetical protein SAMN05216249_107128 [Acetitomaculum ruminis DSM 5522]|uniref:Cof subfamily of IIB subfamily of haloacid dehalogenase superfamily/HAD-superfamily hydrolase, subfamily IIB n=1 Tax=Acetitomaculum ruminis DSM 5522 TaxID=1120918 RepID=A0A1I0XSF7_9FIRM|nr:Cof-type HAD-IIB family hydrolase [Acetitomaculum ruminis]SFB03995.1 hypothetical protein SAMN05216249_107128 [Acetitomaculum ruminis DSM 5522]
MSNKKLLFLDLDGTLLDEEKKIPLENKKAIEEMVEKGHDIIISTGRHPVSAMPILEELNMFSRGGYAVFYNGAVIYDCKNKVKILDMTIPFDQVRKMFDYAKEAGIHIQTYTDEKIVCESDMPGLHFYSKRSKIGYEIVEDVTKSLTKEPNKLILVDLDSKENLLAFQKAHADYEKGKFNSVFSEDFYLEYCPLKATKGEAVLYLADYLGIPLSDTYAVGDGENDISMIEKAGTGIAMRNAKRPVCFASDYITENDNNHCGVAEVIRKMILCR